METFELKYFLKVAETENIHGAAKVLNISPSAISKAISRLEEELQVRLFTKVGRNIRLTEHGARLQRDGAELVALEKKLKESYNPDNQKISVRVTGSEMPLSVWGPRLISKIRKTIPNLNYSLHVKNNDDAMSATMDHQSDFAIIVSSRELKGAHTKKLESLDFGVFAAPSHPLSAKRDVDVESIIKADFVALGFNIVEGQSSETNDGWRDDKFPRASIIEVSSLKCLENLISEGLCLSYLPVYYGVEAGLKQIRIKNCPYICRQHIYLVRGRLSLDRIWNLI